MVKKGMLPLCKLAHEHALHWRGTLCELSPSLALPILSHASLSPTAACPSSSD